MGENIRVGFCDSVEDGRLKFAVLIARFDGKWVLCKHRKRDTYELPGGHREKGETIEETARRELCEETGAVDFTIRPICVYSVKGRTRVSEGLEEESFGGLYLAEIFSFDKRLTPEKNWKGDGCSLLCEALRSEMEKIVITERLELPWTYPRIMPRLAEEAKRRGFLEAV